MNPHCTPPAHPPATGSSGRLLLSILVNATITLVEIIGGLLSNSLALISDSIHNLSDTLALTLAWLANKVGKRKPDHRRTFGYQRLEILSAFINASLLTTVSIYLIYEAAKRFIHPEPVATRLMLIIAGIGLAGNLLSMLFLKRDAKHNLNVKAAYIHLLGDTLSSVAVVCGAVIIHYTNLLWVDPLLTVLIGMVIIRQAYKILCETVNILMQGAPSHLNLQEIKGIMEQHPQVAGVHHIHCWQMHDNRIHFEAHVETSSDMGVREAGQLIKTITEQLSSAYGISHVTLQVEHGCCNDQTKN